MFPAQRVIFVHAPTPSRGQWLPLLWDLWEAGAWQYCPKAAIFKLIKLGVINFYHFPFTPASSSLPSPHFSPLCWHRVAIYQLFPIPSPCCLSAPPHHETHLRAIAFTSTGRSASPAYWADLTKPFFSLQSCLLPKPFPNLQGKLLYLPSPHNSDLPAWRLLIDLDWFLECFSQSGTVCSLLQFSLVSWPCPQSEH